MAALVLLACGGSLGCADRSPRPSGAGAPSSIPGGPDPVVLRVPRAGGALTAYAYPALDSALWRSSRVPALDRVIAFGADDGFLAAVDTGGAPVRIDLRIGTVSTMRGEALRAVSSADGSDIYALTVKGELTRFTQSGGAWKFRPPLPADAIYAQPDGSLIVAGAQGDRVLVWRVRPPGQGISDSLSVAPGAEAGPLAATVAATAGVVGDRVFFGANQSIVAVRSRDMGKALDVDLGEAVRAIAATPSGDRMFVALAGESALQIVDRFEEAVSGTVSLPSAARALRMDPLGRLLLARGEGDSVFVISLGTDETVGVVQSAWRGDLPLVLPDGAIALARGDDVVIANPTTMADGRRIAGGARDLWHVLRWNGFRARAAGLDEPVRFRRSAPRDTADYADTVAADTVADSTASPATPTSGTATSSAGAGTLATSTPRRRPSRASVFTVSFAAVLDEGAARSMARRIRVDGERPRITTSDRAGKTLYRVVLGPYPSRGRAERIGKASGQSYWVFEGAP